MLKSYFSNKNKIDYIRPLSVKGLVSKPAYKKMVDFALKSCEQHLGKIESIHEGIIILESKTDKAVRTLFLNNVVRRCKAYDSEHWEDIIHNHFKRLDVNPAKLNFFYKDFEYAQPLLKVLVKSAHRLENLDDIVYREDLPTTRTFLILDYDEKFHYVNRNNIVDWGKTEAELFKIALSNITLEKIEIETFIWKNKFEVFSLFNGDFSASYIIELAKNANFAIGKYGAILAIPTKGSAFIHPLNDNSIEVFIHSFDETTQSFYQEDEGPITNNYFWFYQNKFELIKKEYTVEKIIIEIPQKLKKILILL